MKNFRYFRKRIIYGLILISSTLFVSCDDLLDTKPTTSLSAQDVFSSATRIEGLVNGTYRSLKSSNLYGGKLYLYLDVRGEDFINVTGNTYTGYESWTNSFSSGSNDIESIWTSAYATINNANILIDGLDKSSGVISDELKAQYLGEAHFIRALTYYTLVTVFAPPYKQNNGQSKALPLRLQAETGSANNDLARSTVADIYTKILEDLDFAENNLPDKYSTALLNTTRAHKNTAIALKTRVYLNKGDFDKVIVEAKKIVPQTASPFSATSGVANALQSNILTIFDSNYTTTESILSMPATASDSYSGQSAIGYIYNVNSEYYLNSSEIVNNSLWRSTDARRNLLRTGTNNNVYLKKYAKASPYIDYIPVLRYAEVLLNYSEALTRKSSPDLTLAKALLEAVHTRSDASFVFPAETTSSADNLLATIRIERRIELLGEGFRSNDLLRDLLTIPAKGSSSLQAAAVQPTATNYIFPYPNAEINANKLLLE